MVLGRSKHPLHDLAQMFRYKCLEFRVRIHARPDRGTAQTYFFKLSEIRFVCRFAPIDRGSIIPKFPPTLDRRRIHQMHECDFKIRSKSAAFRESGHSGNATARSKSSMRNRDVLRIGRMKASAGEKK
jgi:hypothetical protein